MKEINFKELSRYNNFALDIKYAMDYCRKNNINRLTVDKGEYTVDSDFCAQKNLAISNHGYNGRKKVAVLAEDLTDLTVDFSGSLLSLNSVTIPMAIINCKGIKIENLSIENKALDILYSRVVAVEKDYVLCENLNSFPFTVVNKHLYTACDGRLLAPIDLNIEFNGKSLEIEKNTDDNTFGVHVTELEYELSDNNMMRISGFKRIPPIGNILAFSGGHRLCSGIFCENSSDICFNNVNVFSTFGMGLIAQLCNNITLNRFNVCRSKGCYCSTPADATHFVECSGNITVENCLFEAMLDDALNVHGIYTRVISKGKREILVKEVHHEASGIKIYGVGDKIKILNKKSLIPYSKKTISDVIYINDNIIKLVLNEDTDDIIIGDTVDNLAHTANVIFRNNTVRNNRARGMLIASKGKTLIENNYFNTAGSAIKFESDGEFWYESGAVGDVVIRENVFDFCKYGNWGEYVIECQERSAVEKDKFFHNKISVLNNKFNLVSKKAIKIDNANEFCCCDNEFVFDDDIEFNVTNVKNYIHN